MPRPLWKRPVRPSIRRARPRLEMLESRAVPAVLSFENAVPMAIVDQATVTSNLSVPAQGRIVDLDVKVVLQHDSGGELTVTLVAPDGVTRVQLFSGIDDPAGDVFFVGHVRISCDATFDDEADLAINQSAAHPIGRFRADQPLTALDGLDVAGTWGLEISDSRAGHAGTLTRWSLTATVTDPIDLVGISFDAEPSAVWGETTTVRYTLENPGHTDAGPFSFDVRLSADAQINGLDALLATVPVSGLAAGSRLSGELTLSLPGQPNAFAGLSAAHLGLLIDPANEVAEGDEANNQGGRLTFDVDRLAVVTPLVEVIENNDTPQQATLVPLPARIDARLGIGDQDYFRFVAPSEGRLSVRVASAGQVAVEWFTATGELLLRSEPAAGDSLVFAPHLLAGSYLLRVTPRTVGPLDYRLTLDFTSAAPPPPEPQAEGTVFTSQAIADLNGDGAVDLIGTHYYWQGVGVVLGNGDGSFQREAVFDTGLRPRAVAVADLDGDGRPDLAVAHDGGVSVLLGKGDGTFQPQRQLRFPGSGTNWVTTGDFDGDGRPDLLVATTPFNDGRSVSVLLGNGDGTFGSPRTFLAGWYPSFVSAADVNADGKLDVLAVFEQDESVSVLLGNGDGTFQAQSLYNVGFDSRSIATADLDGDGRLDVVTANRGSNDVSVLRGNGDGSFGPEQRLAAGEGVSFVSVADVNADGRPDVLASNPRGSSVSVLLGNGDGTFLPTTAYHSGENPLAVGAADVNGDGRLDLIAAKSLGNGGFAVLLGNGDGSFQTQPGSLVGNVPSSVAAADLNADGRPDLLVSNQRDDTISVLLGNGDGSFDQERLLRIGDGREADSVFLTGPLAVLAADLDGDGRLDAITASDESNEVSVMLGNGDGSFQLPRYFALGSEPRSLVVNDVDGDGRLDLLLTTIGVANFLGDSAVIVLRGNGDGTFAAPLFISGGPEIMGFTPTLADVNGDGQLDRIVTTFGSPQVTVALGNGGTFGVPQLYHVGFFSTTFEVIDVNGDGRLDLAATTSDYRLSVLLGNGDGSFQSGRSFAAGQFPITTALTDLNGDGRTDRAEVNFDGLTVLLGNADGSFSAFSQEEATPVRHLPLLADLDGDGLRDVVVVDDRGRILFRGGLSGANLYQPPIVVNPAVLARDLALIRTPAGLAIAATDVTGDTVSLYSWRGGAFVRATVAAGQTPARLATADLEGDGLDDLVAASSVSESVRILRQRPDGSFLEDVDRPVGTSPVDVTFADVDGRFGLDVLVANRSSGDVFVLFNDPARAFTNTTRYRADLSVSGVEVVAGMAHRDSLEQPTSLAAGDFTGDGVADVLVLAHEARQVRLLEGTGTGFRNPTEPFRLALPGEVAPAEATEVRATDFDHDGDLDLAILMTDRDQVWIYLNDGHGSFTPIARVPAGNVPTGLTIAQLNDDSGDGLIDGRDNADLLIGNGAGDVLSVLGNGDGTFRPFVRADQRVPLAVTDHDGDGDFDVILVEQARDRAVSLTRSGDGFAAGSFEQDGSGGLIGPGDVAVADVDGVNGADLIFANTGSNNVLVYLRQADGSFADEALSFFTGTSPTALHPTQLNDDNGDRLIDERDFLDLVVANQGSNDVSILLGSRGAGLFELGPRLDSGGAGPNAVTTRDVTGDGIPDVLVTNGQSGNLATIPGLANLSGLGTGAFDSGRLAVMTLSHQPVIQTQIVNDSLAFALTQSGALLRFAPTSSGGGGGATLVFAPEPGREAFTFYAIQTQGDFAGGSPVLFTANADGSVSLLTAAEGEVGYVEYFSGESGLETPSALEVLEQADGVFELYLTESGESSPVLLTLNLRAELQPSDPGDPFTPVVVLVTDLDSPGVEPEITPSQTDVTQPPPAESFDAVTSERAGVLTLADASLEGEEVAGVGQQLIGFVLEGQDGFAIGGDGEDEEALTSEDEEEGSAEDRVRAMVIGSKEELQRIAEPEQEGAQEEKPQQDEDFIPAEPQSEPGEEPEPAAEAEVAPADEGEREQLRDEAAPADREANAESAWTLLPGLMVALVASLDEQRRRHDVAGWNS